MATAVTAATFNEAIVDGVVAVDFWASWCGPCRAFAPTFDAAAERHPGVTFAKVDTEAEAALAAEVGIRSIPTVMFFRDGLLISEHIGAMSAAALDETLERVQALDMAEFEAGLAQEGEFPDGAVV